MTVLTQTGGAGGFMKSESKRYRSREAITLASGQNLNAGAVITGIAGTITSASSSGNTGNGVMGAVTGLAGVAEGDYEVLIIDPVAAAGAFSVTGPDGAVVETGTVGAPFANEVSFTLADGAVDFIAGDRFTLTVAAPNWTERLAGIPARGILFADTDASTGDKKTLAVVRDAEVVAAELVHFAGATAADKTAALTDLRQRGIIAV